VRRLEVSPIHFLFNDPYYAIQVLPAFAAEAMADPDAVKSLGPLLGPKDVPVEDGSRLRTEGPEHFARTWGIIRLGMMRAGRPGYTDHTIAEHVRNNIPPAWLARPTLWLQVIMANVLKDMKHEQLVRDVWYAGEQFARDMGADVSVVKTPWKRAAKRTNKYFKKVRVVPEIGKGFWDTMDYGPIRHDIGGTPGRVNVEAVQASLERHLHPNLAAQYMSHAPR
jgi:hypothetical protein